MRLVKVSIYGRWYLTLQKKSTIHINITLSHYYCGNNVLSYSSRFIGLADSVQDAKNKYPEEFL